jgi:hypothetical protein
LTAAIHFSNFTNVNQSERRDKFGEYRVNMPYTAGRIGLVVIINTITPDQPLRLIIRTYFRSEIASPNK